MNSSKHKKG